LIKHVIGFRRQFSRRSASDAKVRKIVDGGASPVDIVDTIPYGIETLEGGSTARTTRRDWLDTGLRLLSEVGAGGLTIDALTVALGVTKGSFYHHFGAFQDYKAALLDHFEREGTVTIIAQLEQADSDMAKLHQLLDAVAAGPWRVEAAVRAWALQDAEVRACQERLDARRRLYFRVLCASLTGNEERAPVMANMLYALYVGCLQMVPPIEGEARRKVFNESLRLFTAS
jgi:AcrR family transcriptional regulator